MCDCVCIGILVEVHVCMYMYMYVCTCTCMYVHVCVCTGRGTCICMYVHVCSGRGTRVYVHVHVCTGRGTCVCVCWSCSYPLPFPSWACTWNEDNHNHIYCGLSNGSVMTFDLRQLVGHVTELKLPNKNVPVTSLTYVPLCRASSLK